MVTDLDDIRATSEAYEVLRCRGLEGLLPHAGLAKRSLSGAYGLHEHASAYVCDRAAGGKAWPRLVKRCTTVAITPATRKNKRAGRRASDGPKGVILPALRLPT